MSQSKYTSKLANTRILIIGGSSGIGYGLAEALIEYQAASIAISSSNPSRCSSAIERLQKSYPSSKTTLQAIPCDLSTQSTLESNVQSLFTSLDFPPSTKLDHIIYTAGDKLASKPLTEVTLDFAIQAGMVRYFAPLMIAKHAPAYLNPGPDASLTLTTGGVSQKPIPQWTVVASYAAGLHGMMRNLALDMRPTRVNLISPGAVDTELWDGMSEQQKEGFMESVKKSGTTGRVGRVEDVVEAYLGVLRDGNCSGSVVSTNGGHLIM